MKNTDALLVLPPMYHTGRISDYNPKEPMGLMYIESALRCNGYHVNTLDADILYMTIDETVEYIKNEGARVIGFSVLQRALPSLKTIVEKLRKADVKSHICCGGFTATMSAKHILEVVPGIDSIIIGDGEQALSQLVESVINDKPSDKIPGLISRVNGHLIAGPPAKKLDLKRLAWPSRSLLPVCYEKTNYATVIGSRGCYGLCTFCSNQAFEKSSEGSFWRGRDPADVAEKIFELRSKYGIKVFKFNDPNLFGPGIAGKSHVAQICKEILSRKMDDLHLMGFCRSNDIDEDIANLMKRAGFERLLIGIESADPQILKLFRKGETIRTIRRSISILQAAGISIVPGFMIFNPYTSMESLHKDLQFLDEFGFYPTLSKSLRIFDGIPMQSIMDSDNRLIWRSPFEGYHEYRVDPKIASIYMSLKTMSVEWVDKMKKEYQKDIWSLKKAPSFDARIIYYSLGEMLYNIEKEMLLALISWNDINVMRSDILHHTTRTLAKLVEIESFIRTTMKVDASNPVTNSFSAVKLAESVHSIIIKEQYSTFPEKYRWMDD